ncbi:MAG: sugar phosphate nucleotidyltransferase [Candidatus Kerfeldbacteria bacterium]|nr:sugar phosphate nucleotidyltransferase [Candidatus Kerfeldbacteria bacterium]
MDATIIYRYDLGMKAQSKARITITLRNDLLPRLDNFIDGENIRNRSHAIEFILNQQLGVGIERAVILAGADHNNVVHALTRIRKRATIEYTFELLKKFGIRDIIIVIDRYGDELRSFVGDGSQWGVHAQFAQDGESIGTAHALLAVKSQLKSSFMVIYSDTLVNLNLGDMVEHHEQNNLNATVALTYRRSPEERYGVARMEGNKVLEYSEKPGKEGKHGLVNAGVYIFEPNIFDYISNDTQSIEKEVLPQLAEQKQLTGYPFQGKWFDIARDNDRKAAENEWR